MTHSDFQVPDRLPWPELIRFGFGYLQLSSDQFWSLTPRELLTAAGMFENAFAACNPPERSALDELMSTNPDDPQGEINGTG